jgi:phage tail-like protein
MEENKGITLYSVPTFTRWIEKFHEQMSPVALALDECGQIYFIDTATCHFIKYPLSEIRKLGEEKDLEKMVKCSKVYEETTNNTESLRREVIPCLGGCGSDFGKFSNPRKIIFDSFTMWVFEIGNKRLQAFSRENYQIKYVIEKYKGDNFENPVDFAQDGNGNIYILDNKKDGTFFIFKYDNHGMEMDFDESDLKKLIEPLGIAIDKQNILYVLDRAWYLFSWDKIPGNDNGRLIEFLNQNFSIEWVKAAKIKKNDDVKTIRVTSETNFISLTLNDEKTYVDLEIDDVRTDKFIVKKENDEQNIYKACNKNTKNICKTRILKFSEEGKYLESFENLKIPQEDNEPRDFKPSMISIDKNKNIFIVEDKSGSIHQFASDGSYLGTIKIQDVEDEITGITIDLKGNLYVSNNKGIAFFSTRKIFTKEKCCYYSKTLDNGIEEGQWHRLVIEGDIPPKALVEVFYFSSDELTRKRQIDEILSDPEKSLEEKKASLDKIFYKKWIGPEILAGLIKQENEKPAPSEEENGTVKNRLNMLFREKTGRYLWLKIIFSTFDESVTPSVTQMQVLYPRNSYLRYLPAIYQENPVNKDFLERFLSIFETVFYDIETRISKISNYFDLDAPESKNFLSWLATWLNLALEEEWNEDRKRKFIQEAYSLYKLKGTPKGIEKLIEIYTGKKPIIIEHSRFGKPMVLRKHGEKWMFRLGINSLLLATPIRGFRLGEDSILGRTALIEGDLLDICGNPFLSLAHRFTVVVDLPAGEFTLHENALRRILDREIPAHTKYNLRTAGETGGASGLYVEMNTRIVDQSYYSLGYNSFIGSGVIVMSGEHGGRVEHSRLEKDTDLI